MRLANSALVAVSTGLLQGMNRDEVEAVTGHEIAPVANGDRVTMALIQGVVAAIIVAWLSGHPPIGQRIAALQQPAP